MLRITELKLPLDHPEEALRPAIVQRLGITDSELLDFTLFKRSYDARKKSTELHFIYTIDCQVSDEAALLHKLADDRHISIAPDTAYKPVGYAPHDLTERPLVVGFGLLHGRGGGQRSRHYNGRSNRRKGSPCNGLSDGHSPISFSGVHGARATVTDTVAVTATATA